MKIAAAVCLMALIGCDEVDAPSDVSAGTDAAVATCAVEYVYDGDTVSLDCPGAALERARLVGFDTPEVFSPGCTEEAQLGAVATDRLRAMVAAAPVTGLQRQGYDRYGRALVRLEIGGVDVADALIRDGLAVPYSGGRRIDWCARLR